MQSTVNKCCVEKARRHHPHRHVTLWEYMKRVRMTYAGVVRHGPYCGRKDHRFPMGLRTNAPGREEPRTLVLPAFELVAAESHDAVAVQH